MSEKRPQALGRTRLLVGTSPVNEPIPAAENPAQTASPVEPFHAPERRKWAKAKAKREKAARPAVGLTVSHGPEGTGCPALPPATRALREKQQPAEVRPGGEEWNAERRHDGCGGVVTITRAGASGLDAACACGKAWLLRRGCGGWKRA